MVAMTGVGYRLYLQAGPHAQATRHPGDHGRSAAAEWSQRRSRSGCTIVTMLDVARLEVPSSEAEVATLRTDLMRAGFRSEKALPVFYAVRILSTLTMMLVSLMMQAKMPPNPAMTRRAHRVRMRARAGCCRARFWRRR